MRTILVRSLWLIGVILITGSGAPAADNPGEWITLFNGTDLSGWKVRNDKYPATKFVGTDGKEIKGARKGKVDQREAVVDAKNKPIEGATVGKVSGKETPVDAEGKPIQGAKIVRSGGRDAILGADGKEIPGAKAVTEDVPNPTGGWKVENGVLICGTGPRGSDLYTEKKFTDYELHVEFQATSNSGVYPHGLYEIQIDNSKNVTPTVVEKDGKKIDTLPKGMCGALYGRVAPSKNMAKDAQEWQTFDITFRAARGEGKTIKEKARITLVWNGEKVIDNVEIEGPTGGNLGGSPTEPGPAMLQGDHGRVSFRNIKLRTLKQALREKLLPPSVLLEVVDETALPKIKVKVTAEQGCPEQPIKSLRLLVDGRPLGRDGAGVSFEGKEVARHVATWQIEVTPGRHTLTVLARSKDDTLSFSNQVAVSVPLPEKDRPVVHLVAVGISEYDRDKWKLRYAHSDAQQLAKAIAAATREGKLYRAALVKELINRDATRKGVETAIAEVRRAAKANDLFVLSFAGHGLREEREFYLMTREADPSNAATLEKTALSGKLLREKLIDFPCQVLLLLDACHSGELAKYRPAADEAARTLADAEVRASVMCAALGHDEAPERDGGGYFTAAIVRALKRDPNAFYDKETKELNVKHLQAVAYQEVTKPSDTQQTPYLKMPLSQPAFIVAQFKK